MSWSLRVTRKRQTLTPSRVNLVCHVGKSVQDDKYASGAKHVSLKARRGPPVMVNGVVMGELLDDCVRLIAVKPPR